MSIKVMGECWPVQVTAPQKAVLMSLADQANDHGVCWPSIAGIVERTCLHRATVIRAIEQLEGMGHLTCTRRSGAKTLYVVHPSHSATGTRKKPVAQCDPSQSATGRTERPHPSQSATGPVALCDPNPKNPQEPSVVCDAREIRPEVLAAKALREIGLRITPAHPDLIAAVNEGITREDLVDMASLYPDKPAGYVIAACRRQHAESAKPITPGEPHANRSPSRKLSACQRTEQRIREERAKRAGVARIA